jgi:hypothetical protein
VEGEGPVLEALLRRLAECPPEFLAEPLLGGSGTVHVGAVVSDLLRDLGGAGLGGDDAKYFGGANSKKNRNRLRTILVAAWLLHDPWFRARQKFAGAARKILEHGLTELSDVVQAPQLVSDSDRREELARLCLKGLGLRPAGETAAQAEDRLTTLNSAERQRVVRAAREAERRAQEIRDAMAKKAAEEAAAKYMSE